MMWAKRGISFLLLTAALAAQTGAQTGAQRGGELRFSIRADPKTFNPLLASDDPSDTVRYLTAGTLIRINRRTHRLEPSLAESWRVSEGGKRIDFRLRQGIQFSDGTPFSCEDVVYTMGQLFSPAVHSPIADGFGTAPGAVEAKCTGLASVLIRFPGTVAALDSQFDGVALLSSRSPKKEAAVLGPFVISEYRAGNYVLLKRNPNYWRRDEHGAKLPYLDAIRLEIQQNRETELLRFRRGQLQIVNRLAPELFDQLSAESPQSVLDAGPSLDWEVVFFNQVARAPIPEFKKRWFQSASFRMAVSEAINREDLCKVVYRGHARPAAGPVSPSNPEWLNTSIKPHPYSPQTALDRLLKNGFRRSGDSLLDASGNRVEFSLITNAGNRPHERMLAMIQQDLRKLGIRLNVLALDLPSLIERISQTFDYEACLMAFSNVALDPTAQMNVWVSSAANHQWNPSQNKPQTAWEAEVDKLMQTQALTLDARKRKTAFDRVQEILSAQVPMIFLVFPNSLSAVSVDLRNVEPAILRPQIYWNVDRLYLDKRPASTN